MRLRRGNHLVLLFWIDCVNHHCLWFVYKWIDCDGLRFVFPAKLLFESLAG